ETGSGKELVGRAIHAHGARAARPFLALDAGALPDAELFTRVEQADAGTLFLDQIGELPATTQARLLHFLDDPIIPSSPKDAKRVDVRLITATQRDLQELVQKNLFRADLLYRLNVARIRVPPLRERRDDIPALAEYFLKLLSQDTGQSAPHFPILAEETIIRLRQYDWPGNVRELRNVLQQALLV